MDNLKIPFVFTKMKSLINDVQTKLDEDDEDAAD
jgi:hypothetical protein